MCYNIFAVHNNITSEVIMNILLYLTCFLTALAPLTNDKISGIILVLCISGVALIVLLILTLIFKGKNK